MCIIYNIYYIWYMQYILHVLNILHTIYINVCIIYKFSHYYHYHYLSFIKIKYLIYHYYLVFIFVLELKKKNSLSPPRGGVAPLNDAMTGQYTAVPQPRGLRPAETAWRADPDGSVAFFVSVPVGCALRNIGCAVHLYSEGPLPALMTWLKLKRATPTNSKCSVNRNDPSLWFLPAKKWWL